MTYEKYMEFRILFSQKKKWRSNNVKFVVLV